MSNIKILYVASEISPFLKTTEAADLVKNLTQAMQRRDMEIRIIVPKFGLINERKNRLHEVVRLSGTNITMGDEKKPLFIKVATIPNEKLQVYFIDNEDYFDRKSVFFDKENNFFKDNDERVIFFCKGVIETLKKLSWVPDIVHCNDWITSLIPLYIKNTYQKDPIYQQIKTIFTVYNNGFKDKFEKKLLKKVKMINMDDEVLYPLKTADYQGLIQLGMQYADVVVNSKEKNLKAFQKIVDELTEKKLTKTIEGDEKFEESYYNLYNELVS